MVELCACGWLFYVVVGHFLVFGNLFVNCCFHSEMSGYMRVVDSVLK